MPTARFSLTIDRILWVFPVLGWCLGLNSVLGQNPHIPLPKTTLDDLIVVFGTNSHDDHVSLAHATRAWRKGIRAVVVSNEKASAELHEAGAKYSELYLDYPDRQNSASFHSQYPGDVRLALAPFLAAKHVDPATYKWLLVGDDDTFWFLEGVLKLVNDLDSTMPYIITDEGYWHNWNRPHVPRFIEDGPLRCLPCNFNPEARTVDPAALFTPPIGCPCTPQLLCEADKRGIMDVECSFPGNMTAARSDLIYSTDGGSGALLSVGLMQALDLDQVEKCVTSTSGSASDHIFTYCMWQLGYAISTPSIHAMPTDHHADRLFNPGIRDAIFHGTHARFDLMTRLLWAVEGNPLCNDACERQLLSIVTCHLRSRGLRHLKAAAGVVRALSELYDAFLIVKGQQVHHLGTAGLERGEEMPCSIPQSRAGFHSPDMCFGSRDECCQASQARPSEALLPSGQQPAVLASVPASIEQPQPIP